MIPKICHQIYLGFDGTLESRPEFIQSRDSMARVLEGWEYKLWGSSQLRELVASKGERLLSFYDELRWPVQKVDLGRYVALSVYGGFYSDMDILLEKSLDPVLDHDLLFYNYHKNGRDYEIDFMGSAPGLVFWDEVISLCMEDYSSKKDMKVYDAWKGRFVMQTTGPYFFDRAVKKLNPPHTRLDLIESGESRGPFGRNLRLHSWG